MQEDLKYLDRDLAIFSIYDVILYYVYILHGIKSTRVRELNSKRLWLVYIYTDNDIRIESTIDFQLFYTLW